MKEHQIAAAYIRVSTDDQLEFSPDSQLKMLQEYAERNDIILPQQYIYIDEGISGKRTKNRAAFNRMIATAKQKPKPFDVILVWKFSRFARNREDSIVYKSMLKKQCDISVVSISEPLADDKTSILIEALLEAMDEYYSLNLAEEVKRGMEEKASRGGIVSVAPFGYKIDNGVFVADNNSEFVRAIFADFANGMPTRKIAVKYSDLGCRTRNGNRLDNRFITYLVNNPAYIGKIRFSTDGNGAAKRNYDNPNMIIADGKHQPLISNELWEAAQSRIKKEKLMYKKDQRKGQPVQYALKGLVRCSTCGSTLIYSPASKGMQCHSYARGVCQTSHYISLKRLNIAISDELERLSKSDVLSLIQRNKNHTTANSSTIDTEKIIEKLNHRLARAKLAYQEGVDTLDEYRALKDEITAQIKKLESQLIQPPDKIDDKKIKQKIKEVLAAFNNPSISPEAQNHALRSIVDSIVYDRTADTVKITLYNS